MEPSQKTKYYVRVTWRLFFAPPPALYQQGTTEQKHRDQSQYSVVWVALTSQELIKVPDSTHISDQGSHNCPNVTPPL